MAYYGRAIISKLLFQEKQTFIELIKNESIKLFVLSYDTMVLYVTLLNTQHYKIRIKGKVE